MSFHLFWIILCIQYNSRFCFSCYAIFGQCSVLFLFSNFSSTSAFCPFNYVFALHHFLILFSCLSFFYTLIGLCNGLILMVFDFLNLCNATCNIVFLTSWNAIFQIYCSWHMLVDFFCIFCSFFSMLFVCNIFIIGVILPQQAANHHIVMVDLSCHHPPLTVINYFDAGYNLSCVVPTLS